MNEFKNIIGASRISKNKTSTISNDGQLATNPTDNNHSEEFEDNIRTGICNSNPWYHNTAAI